MLAAVAVIAAIPGTPVKFILSVPVPAFVNPPVPANAVVTVNVPLFVNVTPVTVTLGIENVPVSAWEFISKVCIPDPAVKIPLLVIPPLKVTVELPELFQVAPAFIVTRPVKVFAPVAEDIVKLPLVPLPTVVVPVTVNAKAAAVNVVPSPTVRLPEMARLAPVVAVQAPERVRLPLMVVTANVLAPLPLKVRW